METRLAVIEQHQAQLRFGLCIQGRARRTLEQPEASLTAPAETGQVRHRTGRTPERRDQVSIGTHDESRVPPPRIESEHALVLVERTLRGSECGEDAPFDGRGI